MAKQKKTWVERMNYTYLADDCELIDYLVFAVYMTCKRLKWDMGVTRQTETFRKIETWLPTKSGEGYASAVDIYMDVKTPGNLFKPQYALSGIFNSSNVTQEAKEAMVFEATVFIKALGIEVRDTLEQWIAKKGEAERPNIYYLITGKIVKEAKAENTHTPKAAPDAPTSPTNSGADGEQGEPKPWEMIDDYLWDKWALELWHNGLTCPEIGDKIGQSHKTVRNRLSQLRGIHGTDIVPTDKRRREKSG